MAKAKHNPINPVVDAATDKLLKSAQNLQVLVSRYIDEGHTPEEAVRLAWPDSGFTAEAMTDETIHSMARAISIGLGVDVQLTAPLRSWMLDKYYNVEGQTLSERIYENAATNKSIITDELSAQFRQNKAWNSMAKAIDDTQLVRGDIADKISSLTDMARKAYAGDAEALGAYKSALADAQKYVDKLAANGAPTERLKKAYQNVIDATQKGTDEAMDKAIDRAINAKARYNAERLSRTEITRAYGVATKQAIFNDEDAIGLRWELGSREAHCDECEFLAEADLYGLGPGGFPEDETPEYPSHPNCICCITPIYRGEVPDDNDPDANAIDHIDAMTQDERESLMGVQGAEDYAVDKSTWMDQIGLTEFTPLSADIPESVIPD
jgi:hypothetical protein